MKKIFVLSFLLTILSQCTITSTINYMIDNNTSQDIVLIKTSKTNADIIEQIIIEPNVEFLIEKIIYYENDASTTFENLENIDFSYTITLTQNEKPYKKDQIKTDNYTYTAIDNREGKATLVINSSDF